MSSKLLDERPLQVLPSLVSFIGLEKAIILQQIHWMLQSDHFGKEFGDGHKYIWMTAEDFHKHHFPFWKPDTIRKHLQGLERKGLLIGKFRTGYNRTKHYRINYPALRGSKAVKDILSAEILEA